MLMVIRINSKSYCDAGKSLLSVLAIEFVMTLCQKKESDFDALR